MVRERVHRNTAESTNARVKWWSIFQLAVLIGEGLFQVWWLKRFFEVSYDTRVCWAGTNFCVYRLNGLSDYVTEGMSVVYGANSMGLLV